MYRKVLLAFLGGTFFIAAVVVTRTASFTSKQISVEHRPGAFFDTDSVAANLSRAIQFRTVSHQEADQWDREPFSGFHQFLKETFPRVHAHLRKETVGGYSLLYTWRGREAALKPILLMGHMDVVPVDPASEGKWTHPPFSGRIAQGYIWGRGALDNKVNVLGILEAVERSLKEGFRPRRTIHLAFGHDEEVGGWNGAAKIAELLQAREIQLEFVLDEGGAMIAGEMFDTSGPVAVIGVAEKGYVSLELSVEAAGGHSSTPPERTAVGILSTAIHRLEENPFAAEIRGATREFLEFVGPEMPWMKRMAIANLWLFGPVIERGLTRSPVTNALLRTTVAPTIIEGGHKENVLASHARAIVNIRILTGDTVSTVLDHVRKTINDPRVKITPVRSAIEPSPISDTRSASFALLQRTIQEMFPGTVVAPTLMIANTDSRHYSALTEHIYRFAPLNLNSEDIHRFHGIDERISTDDYEQCVKFFYRLIQHPGL